MFQKVNINKTALFIFLFFCAVVLAFVTLFVFEQKGSSEATKYYVYVKIVVGIIGGLGGIIAVLRYNQDIQNREDSRFNSLKPHFEMIKMPKRDPEEMWLIRLLNRGGLATFNGFFKDKKIAKKEFKNVANKYNKKHTDRLAALRLVHCMSLAPI